MSETEGVTELTEVLEPFTDFLPDFSERLSDLLQLAIDSISEALLHSDINQRINIALKLAPYMFRRADENVRHADELLQEARELILNQWKISEAGEVPAP